MVSSGVKVRLFHIMFHCKFSTSLLVFTVVLQFYKHLIIIEKAFYTAGVKWSVISFQMSNKFINFGSLMNIYGLRVFWCSWWIIVMLFCFEARVFVCSKKCLELSKTDFLCKKVGHFVVNKFFIFSYPLLVLIVLLVSVLFMPGF